MFVAPIVCNVIVLICCAICFEISYVVINTPECWSRLLRASAVCICSFASRTLIWHHSPCKPYLTYLHAIATSGYAWCQHCFHVYFSARVSYLFTMSWVSVVDKAMQTKPHVTLITKTNDHIWFWKHSTTRQWFDCECWVLIESYVSYTFDEYYTPVWRSGVIDSVFAYTLLWTCFLLSIWTSRFLSVLPSLSTLHVRSTAATMLSIIAKPNGVEFIPILIKHQV